MADRTSAPRRRCNAQTCPNAAANLEAKLLTSLLVFERHSSFSSGERERKRSTGTLVADRSIPALARGRCGFEVQETDGPRPLCAGRSSVGPQSLSRRARWQSRDTEGPSPDVSENLSPREREILDLLVAGYFFKEIADRLDLSGETVCPHVNHGYRKGAGAQPHGSRREIPAQGRLKGEGAGRGARARR